MLYHKVDVALLRHGNMNTKVVFNSCPMYVLTDLVNNMLALCRVALFEERMSAGFYNHKIVVGLAISH